MSSNDESYLKHLKCIFTNAFYYILVYLLYSSSKEEVFLNIAYLIIK